MGRPTVWLPCRNQISAHFLVEECPSSSMDSIQLKHILSVVSQVIGKGGEEHQVVKNCRTFNTKTYHFPGSGCDGLNVHTPG